VDIKNELDVVRKELQNDEGLYFAWQSNIAMAFVDACDKEGIKHEKLHEVANNAAKNFLDLLIKN